MLPPITSPINQRIDLEVLLETSWTLSRVPGTPDWSSLAPQYQRHFSDAVVASIRAYLFRDTSYANAGSVMTLSKGDVHEDLIPLLREDARSVIMSNVARLYELFDPIPSLTAHAHQLTELPVAPEEVPLNG